MQTQLEELRIVYNNYSIGDLVERIYDFDTSTWGSEVVITDEPVYNISYIQVKTGELRLAYIKVSDQTLVEIILIHYARLGAGVIESGHDVTGSIESWWQVFSDGYMDLYIIAQYGSVTITDVYGPGRVSSVRPRVSFPVEFFTDVRCTINIGNTAGLSCIYLTHNSSPNVDESQQYYLYSPIQGTVTGYTLYLHARGRVVL